MSRFMRNNRGQFVVIAAILIAVLTFSLAASIYQVSLHRQELSYKPVQELVLGLTSDFERALNIFLNVSSHKYDETGGDLNSAIAAGREFMAKWNQSVQTAYSSAGLNATVPQDFTIFSPTGWDTPTAIVHGDATIYLDAPAYGFQGYVGKSYKTVTLTVDPDSIDVTDPGSTTLRFKIQESSGLGSDLPIPNLTPQDNLRVQAHVTGTYYTLGSVKTLTYLGNGDYKLTFTPRINVETLGVKIAVITPKEGILVEAGYILPLVSVTLQSQLETSSTPTNEGTISFGDPHNPYPLPTTVQTQLGTYGIKYQANPGYNFSYWTIQGNAILYQNDPYSNPTTITVNGNCTITAFYKEGPTPPPPTETINVWLESRSWDNTEQNKGNITWDGTKYGLPHLVTGYLYGEHTAFYTTLNSTYVFQEWERQGGVIPWNGTNFYTDITVIGDGTLTAVYGPAPFTGGGATLYVDENNYLHPDPQLSDKWEKGGRGIKLPSYSNQGKDNQEVDCTSTPLPTNYVASVITATMYVEVSQAKNAKNVTITIGFYYNGQYYDLGSQAFEVANQDIGVYTLNLNVLDTGHWTPLGEGLIPEGSIFSLKVNVYYFRSPYGTMFVHYGKDYPSQINFY